MSATVRWFTLLLALVAVAPQAVAGTRLAIYAIVDEVRFEPSELEPTRAWISGVFVVPKPISSGLHEAPARGHLYFELNADAPLSTRTDWQALRAAAGTARVVGFGTYWTACSKLRKRETRLLQLAPEANCSFEVSVHTDRRPATPDPYPLPSSEGVVTTFDSSDDICPRFGKPSVQIVADLRKAYVPDTVQSDVPACPDRLGLIAPSDLDSAFLRQTRDPVWASPTEELILQRLARAPGLLLSSVVVECRETICRIQLAFPTSEYQTATGNALASNALNELPMFVRGAKVVPPRGEEATLGYYFQRRKPPFPEQPAAP